MMRFSLSTCSNFSHSFDMRKFFPPNLTRDQGGQLGSVPSSTNVHASHSCSCILYEIGRGICTHKICTSTSSFTFNAWHENSEIILDIKVPVST